MKSLLLNEPGVLQSALDEAECAGQHFGVWSVEPRWFISAISAINSGQWPRRAPEAAADRVTTRANEPFSRIGKDVALVRVVGQMQKRESSFGGTSTIRLRAALRAAVADSSIKGIMMAIDSPGGTVAGTKELADDVYAARQQKPTYAYLEDMGASAAYWAASQATRVSANATAMVGSIGTVAVIEDTRGAADQLGIKVHVISTGPYKGAFWPGTEVTKEQIAYVQELVDDLNAEFLTAVSRGRGAAEKTVKGWADGRTWVGEKARSLGLVDAIEPFEAAVAALRSAMTPPQAPSARRRVSAEYAIRLAELDA